MFLIAFNEDVFLSYCRGLLYWQRRTLLFDQIVLFLLELWNQLLDFLVDSRLHNYSLSKGLDYLLSYDFRLAHDSLGNHFWLCCVPLGDYLRLHSYVFILNLNSLDVSSCALHCSFTSSHL